MANKHFSDVKPNRDDKDSKTPAKTASGKSLPKSDPKESSFKGPTHARSGAPSKAGGKDLPAVKCTDKLHREPTGDLPKGI